MSEWFCFKRRKSEHHIRYYDIISNEYSIEGNYIKSIYQQHYRMDFFFLSQ